MIESYTVEQWAMACMLWLINLAIAIGIASLLIAWFKGLRKNKRKKR